METEDGPEIKKEKKEKKNIKNIGTEINIFREERVRKKGKKIKGKEHE